MNYFSGSILALIFFSTSNLAFATADGPDSYCVKDIKKNDFLALRKSPNLKAELLVKIPPKACGLFDLGSEATKAGKIKTFETPDTGPKKGELPFWCKINFRGIDGWSACRYLKEGYLKPEPFFTNLPPGEGIPKFKAPKGKLTLRVSPSIYAPIGKSIKVGKKSISALEHKLVVEKPLTMTYAKARTFKATCYLGVSKGLDTETYYHSGRSQEMNLSPKTEAYYLLYRAEGMHLVKIDGEICEVNEDELGTSPENAREESAWWVKVSIPPKHVGWVEVGDQLEESGRSF